MQLIDLEDAAHVRLGRSFVGVQLGNWMGWSLEAHASGRIKKPSDMFSLGVVVNLLICSDFLAVGMLD